MDSGISLTSSRNSVPPSACWKRPSRRRSAPVNAPFSWPKSSDSISDSVIAAQFRLTNAPSRRALLTCSAPATTSLPVPDSPLISTVASDGATWATVSSSRSMAGLRPTMRLRSKRPASSARSARFSAFSRVCSMERSSVTRSLSKSSGLVR